MAGNLRKVRPGEPFEPSAELQHATVDAIRYVRELQNSGGAGVGSHAFNTGVALVKNNSGADRQRFDVLGIDDVFPQPVAKPNAFKEGPVLVGITPDRDMHRGRFAVLLAPAKAGAIVPATVAGVSVAKVDVQDECHWFAEIKDGDAGSLVSVGSGCSCPEESGSTTSTTPAPTGSAIILWKEPGLGIKWAVIRFSHTGEAKICTTSSTTTTSTTTTSTTTSTTTTPPPCSGDCRYIWSDSTKTWSLDSSTCLSGCSCTEPQFCGSFDGECTRTNCVYGSGPPGPYCGGSTTTSTTTTAAPTTTTTPSGCTVGCDWVYLLFGIP
ncbi:MAG: hypothetical protein ABIK89_18930, partial [Planctomycetota bacterium]